MDYYIKEDTRRNKKKKTKNPYTYKNDEIYISKVANHKTELDEYYDAYDDRIMNKKESFDKKFIDKLEKLCIEKKSSINMHRYEGYGCKKETEYILPVVNIDDLSYSPQKNINKEIVQLLKENNIQSVLSKPDIKSKKLYTTSTLKSNNVSKNCNLVHNEINAIIKFYNQDFYIRECTDNIRDKSEIIINIEKCNNNAVITHIGITSEYPVIQYINPVSTTEYELMKEPAYVTKFNVYILNKNNKWDYLDNYEIKRDHYTETIFCIGEIKTKKLKIIPINYHLRPVMRVAVYGDIDFDTENLVTYTITEEDPKLNLKSYPNNHFRSAEKKRHSKEHNKYMTYVKCWDK